MAVIAIVATKVTIATVNYSAQISSASLDVDVDVLDKTNFTSAGWKELVGGLKSGTLNIEWKRDTDLSGLQAAIWTNLGVVIAFTYQLISATLAAAAPEFQGSVLINKEMVGAGVGQLYAPSTSWPTSGSIVRDITP